jgi:hypothetical protein
MQHAGNLLNSKRINHDPQRRLKFLRCDRLTNSALEDDVGSYYPNKILVIPYIRIVSYLI